MSWEPLKFSDFPPEGFKCIGIKMPAPAPIYDGMPCALDRSLSPGAFFVTAQALYVAPDIFERLLLGEQVQLR